MNKYIHPSHPTHGKLFPSWLLKEFKKFTLEKIVIDPNVDPCFVSVNKKELRKYQEFLSA